MSNNFANNIYRNPISTDAFDDLNFHVRPPPISKEPIKRDQDSTDDFEHLEREYSNSRESRPPNLEFDPEIPHLMDEDSFTGRQTTKTLLDTSIPSFESDLRPVPATPPPSANSDESDPFQRVPKTLPMDPKAASMAFMETERGLVLGENLLETKNKEDSLGKFDFNSSQPKVDDLLPKVGFEAKDNLKNVDDFLKDAGDFEKKGEDILKHSEIKKSEDLDFLEKMDVKKDLKENKEFKDFKDDEDDTWNLVGKSKFDEPPTKPLPPLPKEAEFESFDPYEKPNAQDKYQMSSDFLTEEMMKKAGQSENETGDSEFESEPEPSPAKSVPKVIKTEVPQPEDICRRVPERKTRVVDEIAPKEIFGNLGLGELQKIT